MDATVDAKWQRWGYLGGVVFVVLNIIGFATGGTPPATDASAEKIAKYFVDNDSGLKIAAITTAFGLAFALRWLLSMWCRISRLEPNGPRLSLVFVLGLVMSGSIVAVAQAMFSSVAIRIDTLAGASEFVWTFGYAMYGMALALVAVHMLAAAALTMRSGFLPAWTAYIALLAAAGSAVAAIASGSDAPALTIFQMVGYIGWLLWILIVSVLLYMGKDAQA